MSDQNKKVATLKKVEEMLVSAPSLKNMLQLDFVQQRFIANYEAVTGKTDGPNRFASETFAYLEIVNANERLAKADRFSHFAAIVKAGTTGLSFRDNKLYVMPGPNNTVKVDSSPAGKREQMEMMKEVKKVPEAQVVMKGDKFVYDKLNGIIKEHETTDKSATSMKLDNIVAAYQRIYWKDGTINDVVVYHDDLLKAKQKSPAKSEVSFWETYPGEACKKVATKRAYRLYHKYPDNVVTYGKDSEKEDDDQDFTQDVSHTDVSPEPLIPAKEEAKPIEAEEAQVVDKESGELFS